MKLSELLSPWMSVIDDCEITGITQDSRKVKPGDLFLAYPGLTVDGRTFIEDVLKQGAAAVLYEPKDWSQLTHPQCVALHDVMQLKGEIANRFFHEPSKHMTVIGVTGTNGKTTIAYLLAQAYTRLTRPAIYIGTLGTGPVGAIETIGQTTPDPVLLQSILAQGYAQGAKVACMEVSSHALVQGRVNGVQFEGAIYTNLTHDHLDYHGTMAAYAEAKALLFNRPELSYAVINQDDAHAELMKSKVPSTCRLYTYGLNNQSEVYATEIHLHRHGTTFKLCSPWGEYTVQMKLIGAFNVYNALAVLTTLAAAGCPMQDAVTLMKDLNASPGRMEIVHEHPCVIVDYAHTPDALENALKTLHQLKEKALHVVFGCGGDRDRTKRPVMGELASRYADHVVITSDNPRTEDPLTIIQEIQQGVSSQASVMIEPDRKAAILAVLQQASEEDIILIAGKGHENYQQIGQHCHPFSDQAIVAEYYFS